ncbi:MAG: single-stranded DNA-binding protein [Parcubacteria group bacterium]|nr:single-stranded DNA-binding protein [Parcubacteria group bacterium]
MNLNKVFLAGNLTRDPEARTTPNGQTVVTLGVATNRMWRDKSGQPQKETQFHTVIVWGKPADFAKAYLTKGRLVFVEGRINNRSWTDQQNVKHYKSEVVAERLQAGPRPGGGQGQGGEQGQGGDQQYGGQQQSETAQPQEEIGGEEVNVDEIPF